MVDELRMSVHSHDVFPDFTFNVEFLRKSSFVCIAQRPMGDSLIGIKKRKGGADEIENFALYSRGHVNHKYVNERCESRPLVLMVVEREQIKKKLPSPQNASSKF